MISLTFLRYVRSDSMLVIGTSAKGSLAPVGLAATNLVIQNCSCCASLRAVGNTIFRMSSR